MTAARTRVDTAGLVFGLALATLGFGLLFTGTFFHFWAQMAITVAGLCLLSAVFDPAGLRRLLEMSRRDFSRVALIGALSAATLYEVFYLGNLLAGAVLRGDSGGVASIYEFKGQTPVWVIGLLMALVIGPGEEIFWRGFLQRKLVGRYSRAGLAMSVAAYTLVHLVSGNPMLIVAALVCGLFWTVLYDHCKSIWINIISHTLWDLTVFLIWPFAAGS
jgi:membrane protease YdiL (CAAX protease family)